MNKEIIFGEEARERLLEGIKTLNRAVSCTLGPIGKNVLIQKPYSAPHLTKDGVTVAHSVNVKDKVQQTAIELLRQAAGNTVKEVGDGTTTSTLLASNMVEAAMSMLEDKKLNSVQYVAGMRKACDAVVKILEDTAITEVTDRDIKAVAKIAANNDEEIGEIVFKAVKEVGVEGQIEVTHSLTGKTYMQKNAGITFNKGFLHSSMVNNREKGLCEYKEVRLLIYDNDLNDLNSFKMMIQQGLNISTKKAFVIICNDISEEILQLVKHNRITKKLPIAVVTSPSIGVQRSEILEDIAYITGGYVLESLSNLQEKDFGECKYIKIDQDSTTIIGGKGNAKEIESRVEALKDKMEDEAQTSDNTRIKQRIAYLRNGVATLYVGGATETELYEKTDRVDDSVQATMTALRSGYVQGGGFALFDIMVNHDIPSFDNESEQMGYENVIIALQDPLNQIMTNAGVDVDIIHEAYKEKGEGFNPLTEEYGDMIEMGIIDPVGVTISAVKNAVSVAANMLMTDCIVPAEDLDNRMVGGVDPYQYIH